MGAGFAFGLGGAFALGLGSALAFGDLGIGGNATGVVETSFTNNAQLPQHTQAGGPVLDFFWGAIYNFLYLFLCFW